MPVPRVVCDWLSMSSSP